MTDKMTDREFLMALNDKCIELRDEAEARSKEDADNGDDLRSYVGCGLQSAFMFIQMEISAHLEEEETGHAS